MEPIEWHRGIDESRGARLCAYALLGTMLGFFLLVVASFVLLVPFLVDDIARDPAVLVLVGLFALVGGPLSLLYLWPLLTDPEQRGPAFIDSPFRVLPRRGVLAAIVLGAIGHAVALWALPFLVHGALALSLLLVGLGTGFFLSAGEIDPETGTLSVRSTRQLRDGEYATVDLESWTDLSRYRLGPTVLLRPTYGPGSRRSSPRLLAIPAWVADEAEPVFERALKAPVPDPDRDPNPVVAATLALFGLGTIGLGVALALVDAVPVGYRTYLLAICVVFGGVFLVAAKHES